MLRNRKKSGARQEKGESTVEFALIAVMLLMVTFWIVEGGRIYGAWLIITNEAREAARWGAVRVPDRATTADLDARVRQRTTGVLDQTELTSTATIGPDPNSPEWVTVRIDYNVEMISAPLLVFLPNPVPMSAVSTMRTEGAPAGGG